ncbi:TonB-dependent receptor [Mangrovibacterium lignilyticum]|uniref:TonB-dependent receptor n=1 Tax=Mangrovibacterium lignilyticum TaxID=2668052 RepID=UPI0013D7888C|nr:TonB-dependent receptor [Mangrovibacterium lignilyticum]
MRKLLLVLAILASLASYAQNTVNFIVSDEDENPLVGANIVLKGTTTGTVTDESGKAQLNNLPDGKTTVEISFIGYEAQQLVLHFPADNGHTFEVELEEGEEIEEVVIASTRSSRTIEDIPTRIEAITGEELGEKAAMNSSNIGMLLSETTGVQMQQTSLSSGNMSIRIQGLDGRYTQILKDGFPLYGGFAGGLSIMQIPPLDLRQVELIKGSNSTLYGGGAIAGLVNLISIQPEEKADLSVMINQTNAKGTTGNLFYAQKFDHIGVSVYGSASRQSAYDADEDGFSNIPKAKSFSLNPKLYFYLNPNATIQFGVNANVDDRTGGDMQVIKENPDTDHVFTEANESKRFSTQFQFLNQKDKSSFSLKNSVTYFDRDLQIPDYQFKGNQLSGFTELLYTLRKGEDSDWQLGANHYFEQFDEDLLGNNEDRSYTHNTVGAFVQNTTDFNEKTALESGLRYDYDFDFGSFVLPRASLLYKATDKLTMRLGGALGYKLPTIFTEDAERLYYRNIQLLNNENAKAERSIGGNFDLNYRTAFFDKLTFSINQLFFATQLKDALVLRDGTNNDSYFENADGNILSSGFETNLKFTYSDFKLFVNYALNNTKLKYDNLNNQKPLTPKHSAGAVLMFDQEEKWSIGYELYYTGWQYDEAYDRKPNYWVMGFMVMRHFEKFSVFLNFENFGDTKQTDFEPLVLPPYNNPVFPDIWAPTDGFVVNGGVRIRLL